MVSSKQIQSIINICASSKDSSGVLNEFVLLNKLVEQMIQRLTHKDSNFSPPVGVTIEPVESG